MPLVDEIYSILDHERAALTNGDFHLLSDIAEEKAALFARLAIERVDSDLLQKLRKRADRNQTLLEAAQRGFGAALTQINTARAQANPQTYRSDGARDALGPKAPRIEKRC